MRTSTIQGSEYDYADDGREGIVIMRCRAHAAALDIPSEIDGRPVTRIGDHACAKLHNVASITVPESVTRIGFSAFEQCRCLRRIVFPTGLATFATTWLNGCKRLEDITLPGRAPEISSSLFGSFALRRVHLGPGTRAVSVPRAQPLELERFSIDPENPWLSTDGVGLYSFSRDTLFFLVKSVSHYSVAPECTHIAPYACAYRGSLERLELPEGLQGIGDLAFVECGLRAFTAPPHLQRIGNRAFLGCRELLRIELDAELQAIGEGAFAHTGAPRAIQVPASVGELGPSAAGFPEEIASGAATLSIAPENPMLLMDEAGLVYHREAEGLVLQDASFFTGTEAQPHARTVAVGDNAFKRHQFVERALLPEGLRRIGQSAFAECANLTEATLPETLERIEDLAFFGSSLRTVHIPARCTHIGMRALDTTAPRDSLFKGKPRRLTRASLQSATVDAANPAYYVKNSLLCQRLEDRPGEAKAVLYVGSSRRVTVPREVTYLGMYAFSGATDIEVLHLHGEIRELEAAALFPTTAFGRIIVETDEPEDGRGYVSIDLPPDEMGMRVIQRSLYHYVDARLLMDSYDAMVPNMPDHFDRFRMMLDRLSDPVMLADWARAVYERDLALNPLHVCLVMAHHDYAHGIDQLAELGFLDAETVRSALDRLSGSMRSVCAVARLLEIRHTLFADAREDFSL